VEGTLEKTEVNQNRLLWYQALHEIHRQNRSVLGPLWYAGVNNHVVTITEWIEGRQLNDIFDCQPELMPVYGKEVGKLLYQVHHVDFVKAAVAEKNVHIRAKASDVVSSLKAAIKEYGIHFQGMDEAVSFLDKNQDVISDDRIGIVHNDVRPENFILQGDTLFIYDFDSGTIGDIYSDFTYLTSISNEKYRPFSRAVIDAYFQGEIPEDFWRVNIYFSIIKLLEYAVYKYKNSGKMIENQAKSFLSLYDNYTNIVPCWIRETSG
jgi:aminoglycoside phosphotransferase (APT) family kinase protein